VLKYNETLTHTRTGTTQKNNKKWHQPRARSTHLFRLDKPICV